MGKLCNKKVIAASLLEWTLGSKTTFAKDENKDLADKAKKLGIELPSPDLAAFETIYCEVDKYNLNGVKVSKKAAEKGIATLIGKQINWNHEGAHQICGYIIDAFIKEDKIYIDGILFKSLFTEEFGTVIELFESGKLFVSFELWNRKEDGTSIVKDLGNGYRELTEFVAHGCALLLLDQETGKPIPPACPKAQVQKLLAAVKVIEEAEIIVEKIFEKDERLVYAELAAIEEQEPCTKCKTCTCHEEGGKENIMAEEVKIEEILDNDYEGGEIDEAKKLTTEQRNALPDSDFALIQEKDGKKIRRFPINDEAHVRNALARLPQAKDISEEEKKSALAKILKKAKELNMDELLKKYEKSEEVLPEVKVEEPIVEEPKVDATVVEPIVEEKPVEATLEAPITEVKKEEVIIEEPKIEETAQVNPEPAQVTDPAPIVEQKPDEQAQVGEQPVVVRKVVSVTREETSIVTETDGKRDKKGTCKVITKYDDGTEDVNTEEYQAVDTYSVAEVEAKVAEAKAEKEIEITNLKTELEKLTQEIAELKTPKVEVAKEVVEEQPELIVGNAEAKTIDKYVARRKKINMKAYGHENKGY